MSMTTFNILIPLIQIVTLFLTIIILVMLLVYFERRISAWIQNRTGPNRVGPYGLLQSLADVLKLLFKEDIVPKNANKPLHDLAPIISISIAMSAMAVIPFGKSIQIFGTVIPLQIASVNVGILFIFALSSLGVYGITLAGWSSNNKYSLFGGLRSSAQLISYEVTMGMAVIGVLMISGTLQLDQIVAKQSHYIAGFLPAWNIFLQPVGFISFFIAAFAETNRLPFDLPEAEPELVGGFHTEYSGLKFGLFFLAEYANMITAAAVVTTLFLGGYHLPYGESLSAHPFWGGVVNLLVFGAKTCFVLFFMVAVRWTLPRFRYDQLMNLGWKVFLPIVLINLLATGFVMVLL